MHDLMSTKMEGKTILREENEWNDVFDDEDLYKDEEFSDFLNKAKENLANLSLNRNETVASEEDGADIQFMKFLGGLKKELSKCSRESKSVSSILIQNAVSYKSPRSQSASAVFDQDKTQDDSLDEKRVSSLRGLRKIENKLSDDFFENRVVGAKKLYKFFNEKIFESKLPEDMDLEWSAELRTTAGITRASKKGNLYNSCKIILSSKVLTTFERLRDTLLHEMCHAAVFLISQIPGEVHGPLWKSWAVRCNIVLPEIKIPERCHSYEISYPYYYKCNSCDWKCGRYRRSIKLSEARCPQCESSLSVVKS